jgi:flavin reductase (DIM6/NTAB) family NADH-FMN oxidoreductase RutF
MHSSESPGTLTSGSHLVDRGPGGDDHVAINPAILYFGTPVVLISSLNPDGSTNVAPMSSAFWQGQRSVLGLGASGQTAANLRRERELVMNLPSTDLAPHVDRLALTTGRADVTPWKASRGYVHVADKFGHAGLRAVPSSTVRPDRVAECPVQLEAVVEDWHANAEGSLVFEVAVTKVWAAPSVRMAGHTDRIDPDAWRPLIMSFQRFYGLGPRVHPSRLASIDEDAYR